MRKIKLFSFIILAVIFVSSASLDLVLAADNDDTPDYVPGQVIVKYRQNKVSNQAEKSAESKILDSLNSVNLEPFSPENNLSLLKIPENESVENVIAELKNDPNIEYAEPNYIRKITAISTNDTNRALLWGLDNTGQTINGDWGNITGTADADIDAPEAWAVSEGDENEVIVAVIDIGVSYTHPDLVANMWDGTNCKSDTGATLGGCNHGYDYSANDKTPLPANNSSYHGTHVAGILGAAKNNGAGVIGLAPHAKIMSIRFALDVVSEVKAIDFAIQNGARIINASFGGAGFSSAEYNAISRFRDAGGIFVAAAGNENVSNELSHSYPSDYNLDNIISVAATDQNDDLAEFSNFGTTSVDVAAPGENILSSMVSLSSPVATPGYDYLSGTSMSTPYVAGLAALIWGYKNDLTYTQVKSLILNDGDPLDSLDGKILSEKRINAERSLLGGDIMDAQSIHDAGVEGAGGGEHTVGSKATLQTAINSATTVKNNLASSSADIAAAVTDLDLAVATFNAALVPMSDTTAPVITRNGASTVRVKYRANYVDAGATATDNIDGDITDEIVVVNPVDTTHVGNYTVTYNVSDEALNPANEVTRTVTVYKPRGGGGGGGSSSSSSSSSQTVSTPILPTVPAIGAAIPEDCKVGFNFSPSTGLSCASEDPNNPARYLSGQTTTTTNPTACTITTILRQGSRGDEVKCLQTHLSILADGVFGPMTKASVVIFQKNNGLVADGIVGPKTVSLLK